MSYRIQVHPEAGTLLRTLAPHLVLRLGRALAELAEAISVGDDPESDELCVEDCAMQFVVDHPERILRVTHLEQRELPLFVDGHVHLAVHVNG
jgi:hypothetical protein